MHLLAVLQHFLFCGALAVAPLPRVQGAVWTTPLFSAHIVVCRNSKRSAHLFDMNRPKLLSEFPFCGDL